MPRRNQRERYTPLDLTPPEPTRHPFAQLPGPIQPGHRVKSRAEIENERADRQRTARMKQGIDWSVCIVPGCGDDVAGLGGSPTNRLDRRDPSLELPICFPHAGVAWRQMVREYTDDPKFIEAIADGNERIAAREDREEADRKSRRAAQIHGHIYFVRLGELIKAGWTRDLAGRLKSYGASAVLLAAYRGTRDDETNLHRQLRPALAKGREWYTDGSIVRHFINEALAKHGEPPTFDWLWTKPKIPAQRVKSYRG